MSWRSTGESSVRLRMSASIESAMPGYWTLIATSRPSCVVPRYTCPMLAAAAGAGSIRASTRSGSSPHSLARTLRICFQSTGRALSRSAAKRFWT